MAKAVRLLGENQVETICHAFGPVVDAHLDKLLAVYERQKMAKESRKTMTLLYTPDQSLSELADRIAQGAKESKRESGLTTTACGRCNHQTMRHNERYKSVSVIINVAPQQSPV